MKRSQRNEMWQEEGLTEQDEKEADEEEEDV